jgi:hypothetical protein
LLWEVVARIEKELVEVQKLELVVEAVEVLELR